VAVFGTRAREWSEKTEQSKPKVYLSRAERSRGHERRLGRSHWRLITVLLTSGKYKYSVDLFSLCGASGAVAE